MDILSMGRHGAAHTLPGVNERDIIVNDDTVARFRRREKLVALLKGHRPVDEVQLISG